MARYYNDPIDWPSNVAPGTTKVTRQQSGTLVSLGRPSARGGVKHLGVFSDQELVSVWSEIGRELAKKGLIKVDISDAA